MPLPSRYEAVLFDCDGVLVDSEPLTNGVLRDMLEELGWVLTRDECMRLFVGKAVKVWPDPETQWRATLQQALGHSRDLVFENYIPAATLIGDQPDTLDALPEPVLGVPVEDVKRAYKDQVTAQGKNLVVTLADDRESVMLNPQPLPPMPDDLQKFFE